MDSLLAAIAAAPDDDAPRLVWADREGGERGELVVLQCLLARRAGPRADRVRMAQRVRELLPRFQRKREIMVRGFVEGIELATIASLGPGLFARHPLLRMVELDPVIDDAALSEGGTPGQIWDHAAGRLAAALARLPPDRIRRFAATPELAWYRWASFDDRRDHPFGDELCRVLAEAPSLAGVTELRIIGGDLTFAAIPHLARLPALTSLQGGMHMTGTDCVALLRALPRLRTFAPCNGSPRLNGAELATLLAAPETRRLAGLDLWSQELTDGDLERIAATPFAALERLGVGNATNVRQAGLDALAASPHLRGLVELDLYTTSITAPRSAAPFCAPPFALRRLRVTPVPDALVAALVEAPALDWLVIEEKSRHIARLRDAIPWVNDGYSL